ncbi:hypothetical protein O1611_g4367 [Lasiodiplodia mahajangana]|uniref:Uncharacterized protein n=1 Tax=Lasiodiplodia mahajangana TaxID=1108764 RepID=A0ACC2JPA7_9PEZI|nr:hypothetical protein O1611_g4367 [Lasiodiplodia mahajangana]
MCCIENMAAKKPESVTISPSLRRVPRSGRSSALSLGIDLPPTPNLRGRQMGALSKRSLPAAPNQSQPGNASRQNDPVEEAEGALWRGGNGRKRMRLESNESQVDLQSSPQHNWYKQDTPDSYITPLNHREFLADVDWELRRFKARQQTS